MCGLPQVLMDYLAESIVLPFWTGVRHVEVVQHPLTVPIPLVGSRGILDGVPLFGCEVAVLDEG